MSAYHNYELEMTDEACLVGALQDMGFSSQAIQVNKEAQQLEGYHGDKREQKADIIVPRKYVGSSSNDLGFKKENGKYVAIISEYDRGRFNSKWVGKLKQKYAARKAAKLARARGLTLASKREIKTDKGVKIQLVYNA
jgi:hypothetical protein